MSLQPLTHADAQRAIDLIAREVEKMGKGAVIVVADDHGELLALLRMDGAPLSSLLIAQNKAWTAARERTNTRVLGERSRQEGFPLTYFGELRFVGWGGGVPVYRGGQVVGAIAVSGLPEAVDEQLAQQAAEMLSTG